MKEHPILYSTPMVQAILAGNKTQTRRVNDFDQVNIDPDQWQLVTVGIFNKISLGTGKGMTNVFGASFQNIKSGRVIFIKFPYGQLADILWVRENYLKKPFVTPKMLRDGADTWAQYYYMTDDNIEDLKSWGWKVKPSIHMPKAAARIWLQIEAITVERLQDISEADARAEGVAHVIDRITGYCGYDYLSGGYNLMTTPYHGFRSLWKKINGEESWKANPWVWAIKFKVLSTTGKPLPVGEVPGISKYLDECTMGMSY